MHFLINISLKSQFSSEITSSPIKLTLDFLKSLSFKYLKGSAVKRLIVTSRYTCLYTDQGIHVYIQNNVSKCVTSVFVTQLPTGIIRSRGRELRRQDLKLPQSILGTSGIQFARRG